MITRRNLVTDPRLVTFTGWAGIAAGNSVTANFYSPNNLGIVGDTFTVSCELTAPAGQAISGQFSARPTLAGAFGALTFIPTVYSIPAGQTQRIYNTYAIPTGGDGMRMSSTCSLVDGSVKVDRMLIEKSNRNDPYFDGATVSTDKTIRNTWTGTANASISQQELLPNVVRRNLCPNPSVETNINGWSQYQGVGGTSSSVGVTDSTAYSGGKYWRQTWTVAPTSGGGQFILVGSDTGPDLNGKVFTASMYIRPTKTVNFLLQWQFFKNGTPSTSGTAVLPGTVCPAGVWTRVSATLNPAGPGDNKISYRWYISTATNGVIQAGDSIDFDACLIEESAVLGSYFDGGLVQDTQYKYSWYGTANNSESLLETAVVGTRINKVLNPIGPIGTVTTVWAYNRGTAAVNVDAVRMTITDALVAGLAQRIELILSSNFIVAVPGKQYTASIYMRSNSAATGAIQIGFFDASNALIGTYTVSPQFVMNSTDYVRASITSPIAPVNTAKLGFSAGLHTGARNVGEWIDYKQALIEEGSTVQPYFDGSTTDNLNKYYWQSTANASPSVMEPIPNLTRRNKAQNPNVVGLGGWFNNPVGGTVTLTNPTNAAGPTGQTSYKLLWTVAAVSDNGGGYHGAATNRSVLASAGDILTISAYVKCNRVQRMALFIYAYDAANASLGIVQSSQGFVTEVDIWLRIYHTLTVPIPVNTDHLLVACYAAAGASYSKWAINDTLEIQGMLVEKTSSLQPYFDGNTLSDANTEYTWMGAANASESIAMARSNAINVGRQSDLYYQLLGSGYGPGTLADMEYKRLLAKAGLSAPQSLSMADLYALAGEKPRVAAFRK